MGTLLKRTTITEEFIDENELELGQEPDGEGGEGADPEDFEAAQERTRPKAKKPGAKRGKRARAANEDEEEKDDLEEDDDDDEEDDE